MGPLTGIKVIEIVGIGPAPFGAMVLADLGAEVLRIDRVGATGGLSPGGPFDLLARGRRSACVDLKSAEGVELVLRLLERADAVVEGFRPGVMERLGLGPDVCLARNPRLVYGRMTGWGQEGPLADAPGHDINYVALSGALAHIGRSGQPPTVPLNLVGDFGGGGMLLALGVLAALVERQLSGRGQVVDAAMVDGASLLLTALQGAHQSGFWSDERGTNLLDSGAPYYDVYETADGRYVSLGSLEPQFYAETLRLLGIDAEGLDHPLDKSGWPALRERIAQAFRAKTRDEWCEIMQGAEVCFAPVLTMAEAREHPHARARGSFVELAGAEHPAPAPRFSRTPGAISRPGAARGEHTDEALGDWGIPEDERSRLRDAGAIG